MEECVLINIDHHVSGRAYAHIDWIDQDAASVGELVYKLVQASGAKITPEMAACLYTTLLTDTGGFCYGVTKASTFALARDQVTAGADPIRIAREVCFSVPAPKMLLLSAALGNLTREGRFAWLWVNHIDMVRTGAEEEDCEGIASFALSISGVEAAVFLRELPERRMRLSLRSKGQVNVAAIATQLGSGGHENAAGCTLEGPLFRALDEILEQLRQSVDGLSGSRFEALEIPRESVSLDPVEAEQYLCVSMGRGPQPGKEASPEPHRSRNGWFNRANSAPILHRKLWARPFWKRWNWRTTRSGDCTGTIGSGPARQQEKAAEALGHRR